jgi:membrane-bound lytic murein transglycosylase D
MGVVLQRLRRLVTRAPSRVLYPVLGVGMAVGTLIAGLGRTSYLTSSPRVASAVAAASSAIADSTADALPTLSPVVAASGLNLDLGHAKIDSWVHRLTTSLRADFEQSLTRMDKYATMINKKLDARQMPRELVYLAMIESNFNPTARSRVSAVGMWQFMSGTARQFGLTVGRHVDERKNPAKSTDAALTYLSELHDRFGSWYLAAAAYNSGQGNVSKAMQKVLGRTTGTDEDFFRILPALPKETQDYVPKLIAYAKVGSDPAKYGL